MCSGSLPYSFVSQIHQTQPYPGSRCSLPKSLFSWATSWSSRRDIPPFSLSLDRWQQPSLKGEGMGQRPRPRPGGASKTGWMPKHRCFVDPPGFCLGKFWLTPLLVLPQTRDQEKVIAFLQFEVELLLSRRRGPMPCTNRTNYRP